MNWTCACVRDCVLTRVCTQTHMRVCKCVCAHLLCLCVLVYVLLYVVACVGCVVCLLWVGTHALSTQMLNCPFQSGNSKASEAMMMVKQILQASAFSLLCMHLACYNICTETWEFDLLKCAGMDTCMHRELLREARSMPTENRTTFIRQQVRCCMALAAWICKPQWQAGMLPPGPPQLPTKQSVGRWRARSCNTAGRGAARKCSETKAAFKWTQTVGLPKVMMGKT